MIWKTAPGDDATAIVTIHYLQNPQSIADIAGALGEINEKGSIRTIIFTSDHEKNWCTGLDIGWIMEQYAAGNPGAVRKLFIDGTVGVFRKILTMPVVTIAAMNGHTWGNGVMFACFCDIRYMRADRGYFCLPEADMGLTGAFAPSAHELFSRRYGSFITEVMIPTARRVTAAELEANGVIEKACPDRDSVMKTALARAREIGADPDLHAAILEERGRWSPGVVRAIDGEDEARFDAIIAMFWKFMETMQKK